MDDQKNTREPTHATRNGKFDVSFQPSFAGTAVLDGDEAETHTPYGQDKRGKDEPRHMRELTRVTRHGKYDLSFHPAFASSCVLEGNDGETHTLYEQDRSTPVDCSKGHPKTHVIRLTGKNGSKRDITITIDDPNHDLAGLRLSLYDEARDPMVAAKFQVTESLTVMNDALTCPPYCQKDPPTGT
jgi:hypothetical protein